MFKKKEKYRVVAACGGYIPQYYCQGDWIGISKKLEIWMGTKYQYDYCVCETEKTAQTIIDSYRAIVE